MAAPNNKQCQFPDRYSSGGTRHTYLDVQSQGSAKLQAVPTNVSVLTQWIKFPPEFGEGWVANGVAPPPPPTLPPT